MTSYRRREHLGPYDQNAFVIYQEHGPGSFGFFVITPSYLTLAMLQDQYTAVFKIPRGRGCIINIDEATNGSYTFDAFLLPLTYGTQKSSAQQGAVVSEIPVDPINVCRKRECEPYELDTCGLGEVPVCEARVEDDGSVQTVMYCVLPTEPPPPEPLLGEDDADQSAESGG